MGQKMVFFILLKGLVLNFNWICSIMKIFIICYVPAQIPYLGKFLFLRYTAKCSQPIRLQDFLINYIVKEGTYYANYKKFVLPSPLFTLELREGCHSQLKMVSEVMANILAFIDHLCWLFTNFSSKKLHSKAASFYAYAIIFYAAIFSVCKSFMLLFFGRTILMHPVFLIKS